MEQYVRITKAHPDKWYSNRIGHCMPIVNESNRKFYTKDNFTYSVEKSDCELVSITVNMPEEKEKARKIAASNIEEAAKKYGESRNHMPQFIEEDAEAFQAGAEWALQQSTIKGENALLAAGDISGEWLEKAKKEGYTISEEQLWQLNNEATQGHKQNIREMLKEWFPNAEVFQPKTYSVGLRLIDKKHPEISYKVIGCGDKITVLQENENRLCNSGWAIEVEDMEAITKEELNIFFGDISSFTLIEPSTPNEQK